MGEAERHGLASYRQLVVWQKAVDLVELIYRLSEQLPADERFGLTSQIRRAAVSVPANIAEGYGRHRRGHYIRHLSIANGSLKELETHLILAGRLGFVSRTDIGPAWNLTQEIGRMLRSLMASLAPAPD